MNESTGKYRLDCLQKKHNKLVLDYDKIKNELRYAKKEIIHIKNAVEQFCSTCNGNCVHCELAQVIFGE